MNRKWLALACVAVPLALSSAACERRDRAERAAEDYAEQQQRTAQQIAEAERERREEVAEATREAEEKKLEAQRDLAEERQDMMAAQRNDAGVVGNDGTLARNERNDGGVMRTPGVLGFGNTRFEDRADFRRDAEKKLQDIREDLQEVREKSAKMAADQKPVVQREIEEVNRTAKSVESDVRNIDKTTPQTYDNHRAKVNAALDQLEKRVDTIKDRL
jgi:hypothetical protein